MKRTLLLLGIFLALTTNVGAGELYTCTDRNNRPIITSSPSGEMTNCVPKASYRDTTPEERAQAENERARKNKREALDSELRDVARNSTEGMKKTFEKNSREMKESQKRFDSKMDEIQRSNGSRWRH